MVLSMLTESHNPLHFLALKINFRVSRTRAGSVIEIISSVRAADLLRSAMSLQLFCQVL